MKLLCTAAMALLFFGGAEAVRSQEDEEEDAEVATQEDEQTQYTCQSWCVRCSSGKRLYFRRKEDWLGAGLKGLNYLMGFGWFGDGIVMDWAMFHIFQGMTHNASKLQNQCNSVKVSTQAPEIDVEVSTQNHLWGKKSNLEDLKDIIEAEAAKSGPEVNITVELLKLMRKDMGQLYRVEAEDTDATHSAHRSHGRLPDVILALLDSQPEFCGDGQTWTEGQTSRVAGVWEENTVENYRDTAELGFTGIETTSQRECFEDRSAKAIMSTATPMTTDDTSGSAGLTNVTDMIDSERLRLCDRVSVDGDAGAIVQGPEPETDRWLVRSDNNSLSWLDKESLSREGAMTITFGPGPLNINVVTEKVNLVWRGRVTSVGSGEALSRGVKPNWLINDIDGVNWEKLKDTFNSENFEGGKVTFTPARVMCCCDSADQPLDFGSKTKPTGRCQVTLGVTKSESSVSCPQYGHPAWARRGELKPHTEGDGCFVQPEEALVLEQALKPTCAASSSFS